MNKECKVCRGTGKEYIKKIISTGEEIETTIVCEACEGTGMANNNKEYIAKSNADYLDGRRNIFVFKNSQVTYH